MASPCGLSLRAYRMMTGDSGEEQRVLFAAAEQGRADIINTVVEALAPAHPEATGTVCNR